MKRNTFLKTLIISGNFLGFFLTSITSKFKSIRDSRGFMVKAGEDRCGSGTRFPCKVSTADTDGDFYVVEQTRTNSGGAGPHFHYEQDEWWYVLKGSWNITIGETTYEAKQGDCVFGPRMVPHSFKKIGEGEGRVLIVFQPAGNIELMFKDIEAGIMNKLSAKERITYFKENYQIELL